MDEKIGKKSTTPYSKDGKKEHDEVRIFHTKLQNHKHCFSETVTAVHVHSPRTWQEYKNQVGKGIQLLAEYPRQQIGRD